MHTSADKGAGPKTQAAAHVGSEPAVQGMDDSYAPSEHTPLQAMANDNPQVNRLKELSRMVANSPQAKKAAQLQAMVNPPAAPQRTIQRKENKTGLPDQLKSGIENMSGYSMDDVKVHYGSGKPAQLQAHAYAQGTDIHIGPGQEKHLAHEAWHVVQQKQGRVQATTQMKGKVNVNDDDALEREADVMGAKALENRETDITGNLITASSSFAQAPLQPRWGATAEFSVNGGRKYSVQASDRYANFEAPVWASNGVPNTAPVAAPAPGTAAYVANVISTARNKDKNLTQVVNQYGAEAFSSIADARRRFALVFLANRELRPDDTQGNQDAALQARSTGMVAAAADFPVTAGSALWNRQWRVPAPPPPDPAFIGPVQPDAAAPGPQTTAQVYAQFANAADPAAARNALQNSMTDAGFPTPQVPSEARQLVKGAAETGNYQTALGANGYTPFVHVGDADAVNMNVSPDGVAAASPLFDRFDASIAAHPTANMITGGYRFQERPGGGGGAPAHSAGADSAGSSLMSQSRQAVATSELDHRVRGTMAATNAGLPYFPEPNLLVKGAFYQNTPGFGGQDPEWEKLKAGVIRTKTEEWFTAMGGRQEKNGGAGPWFVTFPAASQAQLPDSVQVLPLAWSAGRVGIQRDEAWVKSRLRDAWVSKHGNQFAFDPSAALVTDVGRFDDAYVQTSGVGAGLSGTDYIGAGGAKQVDPLALFDTSRAQQSHAKSVSIVGRISNLYSLSQNEKGWLGHVASALLPQSLWGELSSQDPAVALHIRTAAAQAKLTQLQPHLAHFNGLAQAVANMIKNSAALTARVQIEVNSRLARPAATPLAPGDFTPADGRLAVTHQLTPHIHASIPPLLADAQLDSIYRAATAQHAVNGPLLATVVNLVRDIGVEIADFLRTYN